MLTIREIIAALSEHNPDAVLLVEGHVLDHVESPAAADGFVLRSDRTTPVVMADRMHAQDSVQFATPVPERTVSIPASLARDFVTYWGDGMAAPSSPTGRTWAALERALRAAA